jgi:hypothetical protein
MTHRSIDLTCFSPKQKNASTSIEGSEPFAKSSIKRGEIVVVKGGYILTKPNVTRSEKEGEYRRVLFFDRPPVGAAAIGQDRVERHG